MATDKVVLDAVFEHVLLDIFRRSLVDEGSVDAIADSLPVVSQGERDHFSHIYGIDIRSLQLCVIIDNIES